MLRPVRPAYLTHSSLPPLNLFNVPHTPPVTRPPHMSGVTLTPHIPPTHLAHPCAGCMQGDVHRAAELYTQAQQLVPEMPEIKEAAVVRPLCGGEGPSAGGGRVCGGEGEDFED